MLRSAFYSSLVLLFFFSCKTEEPKRPNVVLISTDDQGWGDFSLHQNPHVQTPNLDKMAKAGASFDRYYVSPLCAPTRASLLTGKYHLRTGVTSVTGGYERMRSEEITIAEHLKPTVTPPEHLGNGTTANTSLKIPSDKVLKNFTASVPDIGTITSTRQCSINLNWLNPKVTYRMF